MSRLPILRFLLVLLPACAAPDVGDTGASADDKRQGPGGLGNVCNADEDCDAISDAFDMCPLVDPPADGGDECVCYQPNSNIQVATDCIVSKADCAQYGYEHDLVCIWD